MKDISIIVPVYNCEKYIEKCIRSLINQTLKNIEIIFVNDGSTDNSEEIIKQYMKNDDRIKLINKINGGVSSARNLGISKSIGKYISFVDADDWCEKEMFKKLYDSAIKYNLDLTSTGYTVENEKGNIKNKYGLEEFLKGDQEEEISNIMSNIELGYSVMKLYKKNIIDNNNIKFSETLNFGEDAIFVLDYIRNINSIGVVEGYHYHYVHYKGVSLSKKYVHNINEFIELFWKKEKEIYIKFPTYKIMRQNEGITEHIHSSIMRIYNNYRVGCKLSKADKINTIKKILNDNNVKKEISKYKVKKLSYKLFVLLYQLNNPYILDFIYSTIFKARSIFN